MAALGKDPVYVISIAARMVEMHPQTLRLYERLGLLKRVAGLLAPQLVEPLDVQMQQMAAQLAARAVEPHQLVDQPRLVVARMAAPQQPELAVGVPAAAAQDFAEEAVVAWNPVAGRL